MDPTSAVYFKKLDTDAKIPTRGTKFSAGFDLYALTDVTLVGGAGTYIIPTGIAVQLPPGTYGRVAMRSGLAVNQHLCVSAGVIDVDYTGAIGVVAYCVKSLNVANPVQVANNMAPVTMPIAHIYKVRKGERIAQLIIEKISMADAVEVETFPREYASHAGFGSTGTGL